MMDAIGLGLIALAIHMNARMSRQFVGRMEQLALHAMIIVYFAAIVAQGVLR